MADGQIVLAVFLHRGGGQRFKVIYIVNEADQTKALEIVKAHQDPNVLIKKIEAWGPLPEAAVKALNLQPGEFTHYYASQSSNTTAES
jgi:hypothetical protein